MPVLLLQFDNLLQPQASLNLGVKLVVKFVKNPMLLIVNEKKMGKNLILEKEVFRLVISVEQRKNSESPWGIEPQTKIPCSDAPPLSHRDSVVSEVYYKDLNVYVKHFGSFTCNCWYFSDWWNFHLLVTIFLLQSQIYLSQWVNLSVS